MNDLGIALVGDEWPSKNSALVDSLTQQTIRLAKQINYPYGEALGLQMLAALKYFQSGKEAYRQTLQQALTKAQRSGD